VDATHTEAVGVRVPPHSWGRSGAGRRVAAALALAVACTLGTYGCTLGPGRSGSGRSVSQIVTHAVSEGESLLTIADDYYGTPEGGSYLARVNGIDDDAHLEPGSLLEVPVSNDDLARYQRRTEAKIFYNRGTVLAESGDYTGAEDEFALALRADPRFADAGYNLGVVLLSNGEPERAVAVLEQVLSLRPDDSLAEFALGKALFDSGRAGDAIDHFELAVALDPDMEDALFARAVALLAVGRRDEGVFALDSYLRRFPDGSWSDQARRELERMSDEPRGQ